MNNNTTTDMNKKHKKIRKLRLRNMCEQMLPYGIGMISKFYPMSDLNKDNIYYSKKQYFVRKMLQALSSTDGNRTSFKSSTVSLKTSSLNFDLLMHMSQMLRLSHNMADSNSGDTHLLVAEICHKSLRNQKANELIKQLKKENGKTEDEIKLMKTNTLPSKIYVDPNWFKAFNNDDSSTKLKCKRFLKKGWKLGDGDTSKR